MFVLTFCNVSGVGPEILILGGTKSSWTMEYYYLGNLQASRLAKYSLLLPRSGHVAVVMTDGRVLTAGGPRQNPKSTEILDPRTGDRTFGRLMNEQRLYAAAALYRGSVHICGGNRVPGVTDSCERLGTKGWTWKKSMKEKRLEFAMIAFGDHLYAFGGRGKYAQSSVERYSWKTDIWEYLNRMPTGMYLFAASVLHDKIYLCRLSVCQSYDPKTSKWEEKSMKKSRAGHCLVTFNHRLYALGGADQSLSQHWRSVEMYDPDRKEWTVLEQKLANSRFGSSAVVLPGKMFHPKVHYSFADQDRKSHSSPGKSQNRKYH